MLAPVIAKYPEVMAQIDYGASWFMVLDLSNAFFALTLNPSCWYKFVFTVQNTQYMHKQLPQGFHNAPMLCH